MNQVRILFIDDLDKFFNDVVFFDYNWVIFGYNFGFWVYYCLIFCRYLENNKEQLCLK